MQAIVTCLRRISRIHQYQFHAKLNALVGQEETQLIEAPAITSPTLSPVPGQLVSAFTYSSQVFQCNSLIVGFCFLHQLIADGVVHLRLKSSLPTRQPFLKLSTPTPTASRAFRGFLLETGSQVCVMVTNFCYLFSAVLVPLRGYCDVCSTQIHTQNFIRFLWQFWVRLKLNIYVIAAIQSLYQRCCFRLLPFQQSALIVTNRKRESCPTAKHPQADRPVVFKGS